MAELRKVPLIIALGLILVAVALELGAAGFLRGAGDAAAAAQHVEQSQAFQALPGSSSDPNSVRGKTLQSVRQSATEDKPPGLGIPYLALVDGILAYTLGLMVLSLVLPATVQPKVQLVVTLIASFLLALGCLVLILLALVKLLLMVALFFAAPWGTIAYLAVWGDFPKAGAAVVLSLLMALKIGASVCLPIANQGFLKDKGLIILVLTSFVATIVVSFLHGLVPFPLVSITDALAAIIVGILALIWAVVILVGSIVALVQAVA